MDDDDDDDDDDDAEDDDAEGDDDGGMDSQEERDAKLARQLQAMENPTRARRAAAPQPKRRAFNKSSSSSSSSKPRKSTTKGGGFQAPVLLSPVLSEFLGGVTILPRTKVTSLVWKYIKANGLQNPIKKIEILPDENYAKVVGNAPIHSFRMTAVSFITMWLCSAPTFLSCHEHH